MSNPIAICIEDTGARSASNRFTRCVAVPGSGPGLALDSRGRVAWRRDDPPACRLCVSLDGCLVLLRPDGAPVVTVRRAGRALEAPAGKPVVLLGGDEIAIGTRQLRLHVHGPAAEVAPPAPFAPVSGPRRRAVRAAAAAIAFGSAAAAVEVRETPPLVMPAPPPPVEIRETPPAPPPPPPEEREPSVPGEIRAYVVVAGDTLLRIVKKTGDADTVEAIVERNALVDRNRIAVGQRLLVRVRVQPDNSGAKTTAPAQ